jgi:glycosyltransferase involved in cell wall biosynthesis
MCFPYPGTPVTDYYEYSQELARRGVEVVMVSAYLTQEPDPAPRHKHIGDVEVHELPVQTFAKRSFEPTRFAFKAFRLINQLHNEFRFDILQMQAFPTLGLGIYPIGPTPDVLVLDIRTTAISSRLFNLLSKFVLNLQARLFSHVVVLDQHLADFLFADRRERVTVIPLGADFRKFYPGRNPLCRRQLGIPEGDIVFIYVGNMDAVRRIDRLVLALAEIAEDYPSARLILIGGGNQEEYLHSLVQQKRLTGRVAFTGLVPFLEIPDLMRAGDIGLAYVPDKIQYRNQPPLKTVEYLASGLPVIATDTLGNRRFVTPGRNGLLVDDDVKSVAEGMRQLIDQPQARREIARVARNSVEEFSYQHIVAEQMLPFYEACLNRSRTE